MREDRFHIFTHPEFKDELSEVFGEIMQDFRDYPGRSRPRATDRFREDAP